VRSPLKNILRPWSCLDNWLESEGGMASGPENLLTYPKVGNLAIPERTFTTLESKEFRLRQAYRSVESLSTATGAIRSWPPSALTGLLR
jgi:hypothetical protein